MITNVSSRVTNAVETLPDLNPAFLNNCLQTYFTRLNPTFPVLHRPTFVFKECSPSLLLNAIALGSLFIGRGFVASGLYRRVNIVAESDGSSRDA
ncbi:hypothetical protein LQW54_007750 [Pestalotiopsis sp. IQ-011]